MESKQAELAAKAAEALRRKQEREAAKAELELVKLREVRRPNGTCGQGVIHGLADQAETLPGAFRPVEVARRTAGAVAKGRRHGLPACRRSGTAAAVCCRGDSKVLICSCRGLGEPVSSPRPRRSSWHPYRPSRRKGTQTLCRSYCAWPTARA